MSSGVTPVRKRDRAGDRGARSHQVDLATVLALDRFTRAKQRDTWPLQVFAISGRAITALPPSLTTQQSSRCSGEATIGEFTTSSTVTTFFSIALDCIARDARLRP